ncbi:MAG: hypothetical protein AAGI15_15350 [Pseudomonadota bacterium]
MTPFYPRSRAALLWLPALLAISACAPLQPKESSAGAKVNRTELQKMALEAMASEDLGVICEKRSSIGSRLKHWQCTTEEQRAAFRANGRKFLEPERPPM